MKNLLKPHSSTPLESREFDIATTFRISSDRNLRAAKRPKLSNVFIRTIRSNWQNMERLAMVAAVVGSFALGFPVSTVHAEAAPLGAPQIGISIGAPLVEPVCSYGYYDYAPYACAPMGFWGPEYFFHGRFRGSGPWEGHGHGYNRGRGERNYHRSNIDAGRSPGRGSPGGNDHEGHGGHGEHGGGHER